MQASKQISTLLHSRLSPFSVFAATSHHNIEKMTMAESTSHTCDLESMLLVMKFMTEMSIEKLCDGKDDIWTPRYIRAKE